MPTYTLQATDTGVAVLLDDVVVAEFFRRPGLDPWASARHFADLPALVDAAEKVTDWWRGGPVGFPTNALNALAEASGKGAGGA